MLNTDSFFLLPFGFSAAKSSQEDTGVLMEESEVVPAESASAESPMSGEADSSVSAEATVTTATAIATDSPPSMPAPPPKARFPRRLARPVLQAPARPEFVWPTPPGFPGNDPLDIAEVVKRVQQGLDVDFGWQAEGGIPGNEGLAGEISGPWVAG